MTMKKLWRYSFMLFGVLLFIHCSGSMPDIHYYVIDYPVPRGASPAAAKYSVTIGVEKFHAAPLLREERIVYRDAGYERKYYYYHRWITLPEEMVTEKVIEQLCAANLFKQVVAYPRFTGVDFVLQGTIKALEEWDEDGDWYARAQIAFSLVPRGSSHPVWQKTIEKKNKLARKTPAEVVNGVNQSVRQCVADLITELDAVITKFEK